jgi:hypothetical protein
MMVSRIAPFYCRLLTAAIPLCTKPGLSGKWSFNHDETNAQSSINQQIFSIFCTIGRVNVITLHSHPSQVVLIPIALAHDMIPTPYSAVSSPGDYLTPAS